MPSIAQRQYTINVGPFRFAHNFLVLYDDQGNVIEEINGQPADPETMQELDKYIGCSTENLGAFPSKPPGRPSRMREPNQHEKLLWDGPDVMDRWNAAREAMGHINNRKLTYNLWGSDFDAPRDPDTPRPPVAAGNSNSVNRTLIDAMGLKLPSMPLSPY